jgi:uncharacterized protein (DUF934 family)
MLDLMTETKTEPAAPRLWTPQGFREDEWQHAENAEALAANGRFILPLQVFLDLDAEVRISARERLGVLRATGQVLIDQLPHMIRLGFDEFEVTHPVLIKRLEAGETGGIPLYYQPTSKPAEKGPKYSWRRVRE